MRPLRIRMEEMVRKTRAPLSILEKDYVLSWVLAGVCGVAELGQNMVFKGGTALKKCYFGDYRFSEDLDFSALPALPRGKKLESLMMQACELARVRADEYSPIELLCERYLEKGPHPAGQEAFKIRARLPWQREPLITVFVEISTDEPILDRTNSLAILHGYEEALSANVLCYSLKEIVLEKMRGILQYAARLEGPRAWAKSRTRDYYDLWRILNDYHDRVDSNQLFDLFVEKCKVRNVRFRSSEQFFGEMVLTHARGNWEKSLGSLVPEKLPPFDAVVNDLRVKLQKILRKND